MIINMQLTQVYNRSQIRITDFDVNILRNSCDVSFITDLGNYILCCRVWRTDTHYIWCDKLPDKHYIKQRIMQSSVNAVVITKYRFIFQYRWMWLIRNFIFLRRYKINYGLLRFLPTPLIRYESPQLFNCNFGPNNMLDNIKLPLSSIQLRIDGGNLVNPSQRTAYWLNA